VIRRRVQNVVNYAKCGGLVLRVGESDCESE